MTAVSSARFPTSSFAATTSFPSLSQGASGSAVRDLQNKLRAAGFSIDVDGEFGPQTRNAVLAFQRARGLDVDGVVGPQTWAALNQVPAAPTTGPTLSQGASGAAVRELQTRLRAAGYSVDVDGEFGPQTRAAVLAFQRAKGLGADGVVGPQTWAAIGGASVEGPSTSGVRGNQALANAAVDTAMSMGGYNSQGLCATGVSRAIRAVYGFTVWGNGNQIDDNLPRDRFQQIDLPLSEALKIPGLILTWERTSTSAGSIYGHTAITLGDGLRSASDFIENNTLAAEGGRSGLKIFMPR